jgi:hypothetical protein
MESKHLGCVEKRHIVRNIARGGWLPSHDIPTMVYVSHETYEVFLRRGYTVFAVSWITGTSEFLTRFSTFNA